MSAKEEYNIASRYRTIRKHLDSLGYKQALSLDALPLIEGLLADLIQTTESLKHFKTIAQENIEACNQLQLSFDPYKCDNARLVNECNQLHLDLIDVKEVHQKQLRDLKKQIYRLECECNDLQLASSRNLQKIKELEIESSRKSKKILELQGKCLKPVISNVGLASKKRSCYPLRRSVLEAEPLPKTGSSGASLPSSRRIEPKILDLLSMAEHKMSCLSHEVTKLKGDLLLQNDNIFTLRSQLAIKEKELIRLKKMLEGGRPYTAVAKDCSCRKMEQAYVTSHDSTESNEIRILQQSKLELEQQLQEALSKLHDTMSQAMKLAERNEQLEKELKDIDHIALAVEADCNSAVKENNRRVCKLQEKLDDVMTQVQVLESELTVERREVQELRADLEACRLEKRNIQRTLESTLDEKKQMTDRINQLTVIEKNLNDEIERLSKENESQRQDIIQLQYTNRILKVQTHTNGDDTKQVKEKGEKNDHNQGKRLLKKRTASKGQEDLTSSRVQEINGESKELLGEGEVTKDVTETFHVVAQKEIDSKDAQITTLQRTIKQLELERDYYKTEYNHYRDQYSKGPDKDNADLWSRICELKRQLSEREHTLGELQQEKSEIYREKVNLESRLQSYKNQQRRTCAPYRPCSLCKHVGFCTCPPSSPTPSIDVNATKEMIERLERERDIAKADVERLIEERDALRERLKIAAEAHTSEQRRLRENLNEIETRLKHIEKERQDLFLMQGTRRATINGLEDQLDDMREELKRTKQELATQRTQYFQLRALQDQTDQALGHVQGQLTQSESELSKAMDRNKSMEQQQIQLDNQVKELKQEINTLRTSMTHLDHEKDQLLMVLDQKTEKIADLEREIRLKDQQVIGMEQQVRDLQHKNEICVDQSAEQERQLRTMQIEIENLQRQLENTSVDQENAIQENRRLQDDLAAVTCEVRNLQRELESSRAESYDLKRQLQTYVSEVRRAEELLNRKENERTEMLNHFRSLSLEATVLENNNHSLESEAAEARGALESARDRLLDLERQLADRDCLIRGYETQISELTQNVASMETQLRQQEEQKQRTESDLITVRDLCVKLDQQKDELMQQLNDKDTLKIQCESQLARIKAEQNIIQDQMNVDRATVERLETLLHQARQESINTQTTNQELQNETARLKQKISELQSKLSVESTELKQYQNQAAEYSKQISELRRQVTNERFDRARKEEETRRSSEIVTSTLLHQEPTKDSLQAPHPDIKPSSKWTGTITTRSLNSTPDSFNKRSEECNATVNRNDAIKDSGRDILDLKFKTPTTIKLLSDQTYSNCRNVNKINSDIHGNSMVSHSIDLTEFNERHYESQSQFTIQSCNGIHVQVALTALSDCKEIRLNIKNMCTSLKNSRNQFVTSRENETMEHGKMGAELNKDRFILHQMKQKSRGPNYHTILDNKSSLFDDSKELKHLKKITKYTPDVILNTESYIVNIATTHQTQNKRSSKEVNHTCEDAEDETVCYFNNCCVQHDKKFKVPDKRIHWERNVPPVKVCQDITENNVSDKENENHKSSLNNLCCVNLNPMHTSTSSKDDFKTFSELCFCTGPNITPCGVKKPMMIEDIKNMFLTKRISESCICDNSSKECNYRTLNNKKYLSMHEDQYETYDIKKSDKYVSNETDLPNTSVADNTLTLLKEALEESKRHKSVKKIHTETVLHQDDEKSQDKDKVNDYKRKKYSDTWTQDNFKSINFAQFNFVELLAPVIEHMKALQQHLTTLNKAVRSKKITATETVDHIAKKTVITISYEKYCNFCNSQNKASNEHRSVNQLDVSIQCPEKRNISVPKSDYHNLQEELEIWESKQKDTPKIITHTDDIKSVNNNRSPKVCDNEAYCNSDNINADISGKTKVIDDQSDCSTNQNQFTLSSSTLNNFNHIRHRFVPSIPKTQNISKSTKNRDTKVDYITTVEEESNQYINEESILRKSLVPPMKQQKHKVNLQSVFNKKQDIETVQNYCSNPHRKNLLSSQESRVTIEQFPSEKEVPPDPSLRVKCRNPGFIITRRKGIIRPPTLCKQRSKELAILNNDTHTFADYSTDKCVPQLCVKENDKNIHETVAACTQCSNIKIIAATSVSSLT